MMTALDLTSAFTALFIVGMVWLRTRMQYVSAANRQHGRGLELDPAGRIYFACVIGLLALGWFMAPRVGVTFWPTSGANPALTRVIWFLTSYYLFILVHRLLKRRGIAVFKPRD